MRKYLLLILGSFLLLTPLYADQTSGAVKSIVEEDGSPETYPWQLKVTNGQLTDNNDGTATLSVSGETTTVSDTTTINLTLTGSDITADGLYTAGDALTLTGADFDFDGGATPGGSLGGTWASPTIDDLFVLNSAADTMLGNLTITAADPALILNTTTATDTDFWLGITEDAAGDDDDLFQIGDGTTPGTNPFLTINTSGNVGIGTTIPISILNLSSGASTTDLFIDNYGAGQFNYSRLVGRRANGTAALPTAVQADDALFGFNARGYGATGFSTSSRSFVTFYASQIWTDANQGSYITIGTTPDNSTTAAERVRISQSGNVGIGTTAPGYTLAIKTGGNIGIGTTQWNSGDSIDGEVIANDTIDDDSIDFADVTGADLTLTDCGAITSTGTITSSGTFDATGAVGLVLGSVDITSFTVTTDGTGNAEFTLPNDVIGNADIDWGAGAGQVSMDDIADGSTNAAITLTQETNFETAYTHSQDNTQAHSDYLLNTSDTMSGSLGVSGNVGIGTTSVTLPLTVVGQSYFNGNVGIGTNVPSTALHVVGGVTISEGALADSTIVSADIKANTITNDDITLTLNLGGATSLEIPNAADPTTDATGEIAWDTTDNTLDVFDGAVSVVAGKKIKSWSCTLAFPDLLQAEIDQWMFKNIDASEFPNGIVITEINLSTSASSTYAVNVENWDDPTTINATNPTIDAITTSTSTEVSETTITYATIAAGQIIMIDLPTTDISWVSITIQYYEGTV